MGEEKKKNTVEGRLENRFFADDYLINLSDLKEVDAARHTLLLHSCCGPCSTAVVEKLAQYYDITIYFYNPNITDQREYEKRKASQKDFIHQYNTDKAPEEKIKFLEGPYEIALFYKAAQGMEEEPEGGRRCHACFKLRLEKTAETANMSSFEYFGTTLTVSPYKDFQAIFKIGMELSIRYGLHFLGEDFKKKAGYQRSIALSKDYNLYRQHYCGCEFSNAQAKESPEKDKLSEKEK